MQTSNIVNYITRTSTLLLLISGLLLSACSDNQQLESVVGESNPQILYVNNGHEPEDLDPHITTGMPEFYIQKSLFEGLLSRDPATLEPIPGVASSWEISDDLTTYTFHLRDDARWSDGKTITADDVVYSWQRALIPTMASEYAHMLYVISNAEAYNTGEISDFSQVGAKALNDQTLVVTLHTPTPYFLQLLDHHSTYIVPKQTIESFGTMEERGTGWTRPENLVSNGPFKLKEWVPNKVIVVEKNPQYWDADAVRLNEIHYYPVFNKQTEERMFRTGQIHMTLDGQVLTDKIVVYQRDQPDHIRITPYLGIYYYLFNTTIPPFDNVLVRRALSMAIDRKMITDNVVKGGRRPAHAFTPPDIAGYTTKARIEFDPDQAKQLLAEAGYPNGEGFPTAELLFNTLNNHQRVATALQQMWKKTLNIDITLTNQEWAVYLNNRLAKDYEIARAAWVADYADPENFLSMFMTNNGQNHTGWSNSEYDDLIKKANRTVNKADRYALFQAAEKILMAESPIAPVYYESSVNLVKPEVQGIYPNVMTYFPFKKVFLSDH
ncbi:MAG: oligopeptide transport system substrate-binding protein [Gammaproteobacteria bacterium]|jgi:oligopeptide transport system substrate-binding protein